MWRPARLEGREEVGEKRLKLSRECRGVSIPLGAEAGGGGRSGSASNLIRSRGCCTGSVPTPNVDPANVGDALDDVILEK